MDKPKPKRKKKSSAKVQKKTVKKTSIVGLHVSNVDKKHPIEKVIRKRDKTIKTKSIGDEVVPDGWRIERKKPRYRKSDDTWITYWNLRSRGSRLVNGERVRFYKSGGNYETNTPAE